MVAVAVGVVVAVVVAVGVAIGVVVAVAVRVAVAVGGVVGVAVRVAVAVGVVVSVGVGVVVVVGVMTATRKAEIADWVVDTCLLFGTSVATAYKVAAAFIEALENDEQRLMAQ